MSSLSGPKTSEDLFLFLESLVIQTTTIRHPPLFTVADSQALRGEIAGAHTKNLFLKDKKDNFFLLTVEEEASVDLKAVHHAIGAASRVSFGSPAALADLLGLTPGAVSAFGLINDAGHRVRFFLHQELAEAEMVNCHPLTNEATTTIRADDLRRFAEATGHEVNLLKLPVT